MAPAAAIAAPSPILEISGSTQQQSIYGHIDYYLDPDWSQSLDMLHGANAGSFRPDDKMEPDFGYTKNKIWLRLKLHNSSQDTEKWKLHLKENFKQKMDVWMRPDNGPVQHALSLNLDSSFDDRPIPYPEMIAPFKLAPGETGTLYISYWSEGSSHLAMSIETPDSFSTNSARRLAKNYVYYGMMLILILIALVAFILLHQNIFLAYIAYAGTTLMFLVHADGIAFQYIWPNFPRFNSIASIVTGSTMVTSAAFYARIFLQTKEKHPLFDKLLIATIMLVTAIALSAFVIDPQIVKQTLIPVALLSILAIVLSSVNAARHRFKEVRFYILAWLSIVFAATIMNLRHIFGLELSQDFEFDSMRVVMVFDAAMMGLAIADRYNQLRQSRHNALQENLKEAQHNIQLSSRLRELEEQYALASELAETRDQHFKNTVHDLKQPLHALRLNVKNMIDKTDRDDGDPETVTNTFSYLEELISQQLQNSEPPSQNAAHMAERDLDARIEIDDVLHQIYEMFLPDAQAKKLQFSYVSSNKNVEFVPLPLMRIVTNLVSNAIRYTKQGKILLGTRTVSGRLQVEIHDSGPGMNETEFRMAKGRSVQLTPGMAENEGHGLGLSIVNEIAEKYGYEITRSPFRSSGLGIIVKFPPHGNPR